MDFVILRLGQSKKPGGSVSPLPTKGPGLKSRAAQDRFSIPSHQVVAEGPRSSEPRSSSKGETFSGTPLLTSSSRQREDFERRYVSGALYTARILSGPRTRIHGYWPRVRD
ncbi:hypothetical protein TNCV_410981 [Trichonephila clavipes]|nr:hypothetical protein TNCV_410981 [Trichonephila clavipes]